MQDFPTNLLDATRYFSDEQKCIDVVTFLRWPDGNSVCPKCGTVEGERKHYWLDTQKRWKCYSCRKQFSVKVDTIFEDSPVPLDKWMMALWMLCNCKNGVSSYEISRDLGVTQKSAWFMLHRLRAALAGGSVMKMGGEDGGGPIEIDETFIGGKVKNMHKSKRPKKSGMQGGAGKAIVLGMLQRGGRVRARVIVDRLKKSIDPVIAEHVAAGSHIITDEFSVYPHLSTDYIHEVINHVEGYVREHVHTNGIENFWSLLKRGLNGTYVSVEPFHLDAYVIEQAFRYNNRATNNPLNDADRFVLAMSQISGKRLTYAALTGKVPPSF
jgi:transposase-like protein